MSTSHVAPITEGPGKQAQIAAASEERLREQMQALQRKLLRVVTENEALRHVVDKLQGMVLGLRRQMQSSGLEPAMELDDSLLRPSAPLEAYQAMVTGMPEDDNCLSPNGASLDSAAAHQFHLLQDLAELQKANAKLQLAKEQSLWDATVFKGKYDKALADKMAAEEESAMKHAQNVKMLADAAEHIAEQQGAYDALAAANAAQFNQLQQAAAEYTEQKAQLDKVVADAIDQKGAYDKLIVDSTAQKAVFDKVVADAVEQKDIHDKLVEDSAEQRTQLDKVTADAVHQKLAYDELVTDNAAQKCILDKVAADAAEQKGIYDELVVNFAVQKAQLDRAFAHAAERKGMYDKLVVDSAEQKAQLDKVVADAAEQKGAYDRLVVDSTAQKAVWDKVAADASEQKGAFDDLVASNAHQKSELDKASAAAYRWKATLDKVSADAAEQKGMYDKLIVDSAEQKAQLDKVTADASEQKGMYDKLIVDSAEQKAQLDKVAADAIEQKGAYDTLVVNSAVQKAQLDKASADAVEHKGMYDKLVVDAVEQKTQLDKATANIEHMNQVNAVQQARLDKAHADTVHMKMAYDDLLLDNETICNQLDKAAADAVEYKATLDKTAADAAEQKDAYDKLLVDTAEQKAQLDKAAADAAGFKATLDKTVADSVEQKAQLDKAAADAAGYKASLDKTVADAAEQKAQLDKATAELREDLERVTEEKVVQQARLNKAHADTVHMKMAYDDLLLDNEALGSELDKAALDAAGFKANLDKTVADAAEQKAVLDKVTADAVEYKATLDKTAADAVEAKGAYDKLIVDSAEQKAQLDKVTADAAEQKGAYDKLLVKSSVQKAQLHKVTADAVHQKQAYDALVDASTEQKTQLDKAEAESAAHKGMYDKLQALHDELESTARLHKAQADKAADDISRMEMNMNQVQEQLAREREHFTALNDEHQHLLRQQEVLHAELLMALGNYQPKTIIDAGTPADKLLAMMSELLEGSLPTLPDILLVQSTILESKDIYKPFRLDKQLMEANTLDVNVGRSLVHLLGDRDMVMGSPDDKAMTLEDICQPRLARRNSSLGTSNGAKAGTSALGGVAEGDESTDDAGSDDDVAFGSLRGALTSLLHMPDRSSSSGAPLQQQQQQRGSGPGDALPLGLPRSSSTISASLHKATLRLPSSGTATPDRGTHTSNASSSAGDAPSAATRAADGVAAAPEAASLASRAAAVPPPIMDEVEHVLATAEGWQWDAFALADATRGHPLSTLGYYLFHRADLISRFSINPRALARFLRRVEEGYQANPYHNCTHASDVLQSMAVIINRGGLSPGYADPLQIMACYCAAILHDYDHGGLTNDYLINSLDDLAIMYNDRSPLENHHLAAGFMLLRTPECNFLQDLSRPELDKFRRTVIELVLATDMKQHFSILSHFTTVHRLNAAGTMTPISSSENAVATRRRYSGASSRGSSNGTSVCSVAASELQVMLPLDENERMLSLQMALKCSDLGHVMAALPVHRRWVANLEEEFFRQGDTEKANSLAVSPLFDREQQGITKSQIGFFDIVVIPLYHTFNKVFTQCKPQLTYVMRNYAHWSEVAKQAAAANGAATNGANSGGNGGGTANGSGGAGSRAGSGGGRSPAVNGNGGGSAARTPRDAVPASGTDE